MFSITGYNNTVKNYATYQEDVKSTASKRAFKSQRMFCGLSTYIANKNLL